MAFVNASMQRITYGHPLLITPFLLQDTLVNVASVSTQRIERLEPFSIEEPVPLENDMSVSYFRPRADRIASNYNISHLLSSLPWSPRRTALAEAMLSGSILSIRRQKRLKPSF